MACQDARRAFPYMVAGEIPLTEWALLERHVGGCDECRAELDRLREQAAARVRALERHARRSVLAAITALVVIGGATLYVHQYGLPEISPLESFRFSTLWPSAPPEPSAPSPSPVPPASSVAKPLPAPAVSTQPTDLPTATGRAPRSVPTAAPTPAPGPGPVTEPPPSVQPPPVVKPAPPPEPKPEVVAKPAPPPAAPAPPPAPVSPPPAVNLAPAPATAATPAPSASPATASDERMPTQGSIGRVINAAPTAETMPTQGQAPARSRP
jgi:hypothetical protein